MIVASYFPYWILLGLLATGGVALLRRWAEMAAVLDIPNERSSHETPTPRGGGLAIVLALGIGWLGLAIGGDLIGAAWGIVVGFALIAAVSWVDDLRGVSNRVRFGIHFAATGLLLWTLGPWDVVTMPVFGSISLGIGGVFLSALWVLGLTNAYNFMDGIDGIAGGQAVVAGVGWTLVGGVLGAAGVVGTAGVVAAASLAFVLFNWSPARIFMGDVGSASLGFLFAALPFLAMAEAPGTLAPRMPVAALLLVWPFVFDAVFTILRRLRRRENVFVAHRSHLYQRLTQAGWSHRGVAILYISLACIGVLAAMVWVDEVGRSADAVVLGVMLLGVALVAGVEAIERAQLQTQTQKATT